MSKGSGPNRIRNVMSNWGGYVFSAVVNFLLAPFVVHSLGDEAYGVWVLLGSLVGYLGLLDLGVRGAVTRFISKYHAQGDHIEAIRIASSALVIFSITGLIAIVVASVVAIFVGHLFQIPAELIGAAQLVLVIGGVNMAVSMTSGVFGGVVVGLQKFDYMNSIEICIGALRAVAIYLALKSGFSLIALATIQLGVSVLRWLANYFLSRRFYPQLKIKLSEAKRSHFSVIFSFSVSVLLLQASGMLIFFADSVVIGVFLPLSMVTFFAIAANLIEYARAPISGITFTLTPWVSTLEADGDLRQVERVVLMAARIATLIALPVVITFILRGESFINLWMGPEYGSLSGTILIILSVSLWVTVGKQVVVSTMMGISKHGGLVPAFVIEALSNLALSVILVQFYGIIGVAWGTLLPRLVSSLFFTPWYVGRVLGTPIPVFWQTVWIKPAAAMVPFAIASWLVERWWPAENLILYFAQVLAVLPLAALGAWTMSLTSAEKNRLVPPGSLNRLVRRNNA